ncbi:HigA family addiction module antitoxin [Allopusillimonas ginsengisoli]|uniref:HigA family addiction module antitoxin n=1 Tax=Allopusillimonas ginsengisoli TaxID=453575 RepID=UPI001022258B|nr:HigA family addiction module antitoxin [Allopusillimonas ginsengisoli]TEA78221.1 addiction module antidote protein, HigA family [Allopusillimonas ginsengisoli]
MNTLSHPHPGSTIRDQVIEPLRLTVSEAAQKLGMSRTALSRVINGRAGISPDLAIRLEMAGISTARFWTALQTEYDLAQARQRKQPHVDRLMPNVTFAS